jgi:hypothetical protein
MPAPRGTRPPAAGRGRPKGSPNRLTNDVKGMILAALQGVGGQAYLEEQARKNPVAFMTLLGKVLPTQIGGDPADPLKVIVVRYVGPQGRIVERPTSL